MKMPPLSLSAHAPSLIVFERPPRISGVYFLCTETEVAYVGQSIDVVARIDYHRQRYDRVTSPRRSRTRWDRVFYIRVPEQDLLAVEGAFIRTLNPLLNARRASGFPVACYSNCGERSDADLMRQYTQEAA